MAIPSEVSEYMKKIGAKGGASKSKAKKAAGRRNVAKALAARLAKQVSAK